MKLRNASQISSALVVTLLVITFLLLTACAQNVKVRLPFTSSSPSSMVDVPQPEAGKAVVVGRLFSTTNGEPLANVVVRLAEVYYPEDAPGDKEKGVYILDNAFSPSATTNEQGIFVFINVEPRDYVIFVGDLAIKYAIVLGSEGTPQIWTIQPDEVNDLGNVRVDY